MVRAGPSLRDRSLGVDAPGRPGLRVRAIWGNLRGLRDRFGNWVRITTGGGQANLSRIEASNGRWLAFTYDTSGSVPRISQIQDNLGRTWTYAYEAGPERLQTVTDPESGVTTYTYDASHRMLISGTLGASSS